MADDYTIPPKMDKDRWNEFIGKACKIKTVQYVGDGLDNHQITGIGFQPTVVIIVKSTDVETFNLWTAEMGANNSYYLQSTGEGFINNGIKGALSDGFNLGTSIKVNKASVTFYAVCLG